MFVLEVMGRHTGWIAAAGGLAGKKAGDPPHIILFPEVPFEHDRFIARVERSVKRYEYCVIVVSEGARYANGRFLSDAGSRDAFGHIQLGGVGPVVADMVKQSLGYKYHWAVADYLQRSARHLASAVDVKQAYAVGRAAVQFAIRGRNAVMPAIVRTSDNPYRWKIREVRLSRVANREKMMPAGYITRDGFGITAACRRYLEPLIRGEDYPPFRDGLPAYVTLKNLAVARKLGKDFVL